LENLNDKIDIILSDYVLSQFSGLRALELLKERGLDIPFIIVSGTIGEDTAVAAMRSGAMDYLLKGRPARLGQAVEQVIQRQKRIRAQRRQSEAELKNLRRLHEVILNSVGDGIYGINRDGEIIFQNPKAAELLGWKLNELLGKPAHATIHYKKRDGRPNPLEACGIYAVMQDGMPRRVSNDTFWRKDGTSFPVEYVAAPMKDEDGSIPGAIVVFNDITAEIDAQARVRLQTEQYRLLFETNPNAMWVFDTQTLRILAVNEAAIAQYGYSREEFLELELPDLRRPEEKAELGKALPSPQTQAHLSGEFRHQRKDGSLMDVVISSSPLLWDGVAARMVTAMDVTERKSATPGKHRPTRERRSV
ncbi:MAG: PAS domain S-box protein, partial [Chthoniobacterales bacterium]